MKQIISFFILLLLPATLVVGQRSMRSILMGQRSSFAQTPALNHDWRPGMVNITEAGYGLGLKGTSGLYSAWYASITNVTGYQFNRYIKTGLGYGIQKHSDGLLLPLYIDTRVNLGYQRYVPFVALAAGAAISPEEFDWESRIFVFPSAGIRFVAATRLCVNFSTGLMVQEGGLAGRSSYISFKLGVEFKGQQWEFLR